MLEESYSPTVYIVMSPIGTVLAAILHHLPTLLHNIRESHRNINVSSAHQNAVCSFGTNLVFLWVLEVTTCFLVVNQLSLVISPYLHVTPHLTVHSNYVGFMIISKELLQYEYIIYKMISHN